ncbi:AAA family ATPase [Peribacillus sp. NPDC101481]|uniref:AAA family ATPase n=1 Tax=Peribacillus sp. NPDC101481 TaxID=3364403 RepID=UPI00381ACBC9
MIFVDRSRVAEPDIFKKSFLRDFHNRLANFYRINSKVLKQQKIQSIPDYELVRRKVYNPEVKDALNALFTNKCAFCESKINYNSIGEICKFRPVSGALSNGQFDHLHYGWLSFHWENLYFSCSECNSAKSNYFPVDGKRANYNVAIHEVRKTEHYLLVDPCYDNPQEHISFTNKGEAIALTIRGKETISTLQLNRPALIDQRKQMINYLEKHFINLREMINNFNADKFSLKEIKDQLNVIFKLLKSPETEYRGCLLAIARETLLEDKTILEFVDNHNIPWDDFINRNHPNTTNVIEVKHENKYRTIKHIKVQGLRGIEDFELNLNDDENNNWLMILGENATGKSTLLKLIALNLAGKDERNKLYSRQSKEFVEKGKEYGFIRLVFTGEPYYQRELLFDRRGFLSVGEVDEPFELPVLGYGPIRLPSRFRRKRSAGGVSNLFDPLSHLLNTKLWLLDAYKENPELFSGAVRCIRTVMPLENRDDREFILTPARGSLVFKHLHRTDSNILFDSLSAGYRNIITLVSDIFHRMGKEDSNLARGIVLLDEIDLHLHPRWKMSIVGQLKNLFPKVQFITTSHDPLCLRGLYEGEIMVLDRLEQQVVVHFDELPSPLGLRADQLLTSNYFGLHSTIDQETEEVFREYYDLLAKRGLTESEKKRVSELKISLDELNYMGSGRREQLMYTAIDQYLANSKRLSPAELRERAMEKGLFDEISKLWKEASPEDSV